MRNGSVSESDVEPLIADPLRLTSKRVVGIEGQLLAESDHASGGQCPLPNRRGDIRSGLV